MSSCVAYWEFVPLAGAGRFLGRRVARLSGVMENKQGRELTDSGPSAEEDRSLMAHAPEFPQWSW